MQSFSLPAPTKKAADELATFRAMINDAVQFTFIRFSDGECEMLQGNSLEISNSGVKWSRGSSSFRYPDYDFKSFVPERDAQLMDALSKSAEYRSTNFYKGIPTSHNAAPAYSKMLFEMNGSSSEGLTFADVFINSNYKKFSRGLLGDLRQRSDVALIGNFRMKVPLISSSWTHYKIGDNLFQSHEETVSSAMSFIRSLPVGAIVLSSASSISNILGHQVSAEGLPISFLDVGTALHPFVGLADSRREYQSQLEKWRPSTVRRKLGYYLSASASIRW